MTIATDRDRVRLMIGDTDEADKLLYDDEIAHFLETRTFTADDGTETVNLPAAAADSAAAIAAKFARRFSFAEDGQRFEVAQRVSHYLQLEAKLRSRAGGEAVAAFEPAS